MRSVGIVLAIVGLGLMAACQVQPSPVVPTPTPTAAATPTPTPVAETPTATPIAASGPDKLSLVGIWPFGPSWTIEAGRVGGKPYAFLASGGGVYIVDISRPEAPKMVSDTIRTKSVVLGLALSEGVLYVAANDDGLFVYDVSSPATPKLLSTVSALGGVGDVAVQGRYAYAVDEHNLTSSLRVLDVSDPSQPKEMGEYVHSWRGFHVAVQGDRAYMEGEALATVDISDPAHPTEVARFTPPGGPYVGDDGRLYLAAGYRSGLQVLDLGRGDAPTLLGTYDTPGDCEAVAVRDGHAYVADGGMGLRVYDVSDPSRLQETSSLAAGYAMDISLMDGYAYLADLDGGLHVVDISAPDDPKEVGSFSVPGDSLGVAVRPPYAFVATGLTGVKVLDVSDPAMPKEVGGLDTPGEAWDVLLSGKYLYVADWGTGVVVMDVSDPRSPRQVGSIETEGKAEALHLDGSRLYVNGYRGQDANDAITILDVGDPPHPERIGMYTLADELPGRARIRDVMVQGALMYVLIGSSISGYSSLLVVDVTNHTSPNLVARYKRQSVNRRTDWTDMDSLVVAGNYAYVGAHPFYGGPPTPTIGPGTPTPPRPTQGIIVLDISDPKEIREVGRVEAFVPTKMVLAGSRLFAIDNARVAMFDVNQPSQPRLIDLWDGSNNISSLQVSGRYVYLTRGQSGRGQSRFAGVMVLGEPSK
ncbi:MAG: hypothetical protein Q8O40_11620 [Chloroflexota bacterium]|nr:hypothetical protein [Chloroflexota bacterium]